MKMVQILTGDTFPVKENIKTLGFKWLGGDKIWVRWWNMDHQENKQVAEKVDKLSGVLLTNTIADYFIGTSVDPLAGKNAKEYANSDGWKLDVAENSKKMDEEPFQYSYVKGDEIEITAWVAKQIGKEKKIETVFRNLKITEIDGESNKAIKVKIEFVSKIAACCHVCGAPLDNEVSLATGIGPVCARKIGLPRPTMSNAKLILEELEKYAKTIGEIGPIWLAKSQIKQRVK